MKPKVHSTSVVNMTVVLRIGIEQKENEANKLFGRQPGIQENIE